MDNLKPVLGISIILILVFIAGRFWKKKADLGDSPQYDDWEERVAALGEKNPGPVAPRNIQEGRAVTLIKAFEHLQFGMFPATDEEKVYSVFRGFQSIDDFVKFNSIFRWNGKNLTESIDFELTGSEKNVVNSILRQKIGIELL